MPLHPQSEAFLASIRQANDPNWPDMPLEKARQKFDDLGVFGDVVEVDNVEDQMIAGVPTRFYHVNKQAPRNVVVFFHGGGWVLGSLDSHDALCRRLAKESDATVVSVDYRRPPECPFPAAVEDCFTVCDVLGLDYESFGVTNRMVVAGDSAGGNLAAAVSLMASQRGGPLISGQVLIYPVLDSSMDKDSYKQFGEDHGLTAETMAWFWEQYVGDKDSVSRSNPLASLIHVDDLSGLPPAHVLLAEYDVLLDEGKEFAKRLEAADVPTTVKQYDGMLHGFIHFAGLFDDAIVAAAELGARCKELLAGK